LVHNSGCFNCDLIQNHDQNLSNFKLVILEQVLTLILSMIYSNNSNLKEFLRIPCRIAKQQNGMALFDRQKDNLVQYVQANQTKIDKYISGIDQECAKHKNFSELIAYLKILLQKWENNLKIHEEKFNLWEKEGLEDQWLLKWEKLICTKEYSNKTLPDLKITIISDFERELERYFADLPYAPAYFQVIGYIKDSISYYSHISTDSVLNQSESEPKKDPFIEKNRKFKEKLLPVIENLQKDGMFTNEDPDDITTRLIDGGIPVKWTDYQVNLYSFVICLEREDLIFCEGHIADYIFDNFDWKQKNSRKKTVAKLKGLQTNAERNNNIGCMEEKIKNAITNLDL
jgi:hypothetical protein